MCWGGGCSGQGQAPTLTAGPVTSGPGPPWQSQESRTRTKTHHVLVTPSAALWGTGLSSPRCIKHSPADQPQVCAEPRGGEGGHAWPWRAGVQWCGQGSLCRGPRARGFVLLGLWRPTRAVALGSAPWLGVGVGALGGLSRVSPHLGRPAVLCVQVPWGHARVEGLHTVVWCSSISVG